MKRSFGIFSSHFQNVSVRLSPRRIENSNHRHTKRIPRIVIFDQRRDWSKWDVLKLALLFPIIVLFILSLVIPAYAESEKIEKSFSVKKGGELIIDSDLGEIRVDTWDEDEVSVLITKQARNQERLDAFEVEMDQRGNDIHISGDNELHNRVRVEFRIKVPKEYNVDLSTGGGSINVDDINGDVKLDTSGGSITIGSVSSGDIDAHTSGGNISVADVTGNVAVDTSGGSISIGNVDDGNVDAHTSGGNIRVGDVGGELKVHTSGGSIILGTVTGTSSIHTSGGSISLGHGGRNVNAHTSGGGIMIGPSKGNVNVHTSGGNINIGMTDGDVDANTSGGSISVSGSKGTIGIKTSGGNLSVESSGGPVRANTSGGSIRIMQAKGAIDAGTSGGAIEAEMIETDNSKDTHVKLHSSGGPLTVYLPTTIEATVSADLKISDFADRDYEIYTDFPLSIKGEDSDHISARGNINGGGDRIQLNTTNGDIQILKLK